MNTKEYQKITQEMMASVDEVHRSKGSEYTGDNQDRLINFKEIADELAGATMSPEVVWYVYFRKHVSAIASYIKRPDRKMSEPIESRIMDGICYLLLLNGLVKEKENNQIDNFLNKK